MVRIKPGNLFARPAARVVSLEAEGGTATLRLQVDGMVCDL